MIRAVIFDLDDTLISEREYIRSGYRKVAEELAVQYPVKKAEQWYQKLINTFNAGSKKVFNDVLEQEKIDYPAEQISALIQCYRNHYPDISFLPDAWAVIVWLNGEHIPIGVLSDGYLETQRAKCQALNLKKIADYIILTEEYGRAYWKPHPQGYEEMQKYFGCQWEQMIYVGDNPEKDFAIRRKYPIHTVQIQREGMIYQGRDYLYGIRPEYSINNLEELKDIISLY